MTPARQHDREARVYSPDGQWAAWPGPHNTLMIERAGEPYAIYYGLQDGVYRREVGWITAIVWRPDGARIIVASSTGSIHELTRCALHVRTLRGADRRAATALDLLPEGKLFAYEEGETIGVWNL